MFKKHPTQYNSKLY